MPHTTAASLACALGAVMLLLSAPLSAQTNPPAETFDALGQSVTAGERIVVTTTDGAVVKGRLVDVDRSVLLLEHDGRTSEFRERGVVSIRTRGDRLWDGALLGAGGGAAGGALFGRTRSHSEKGLAAGVGALIGLGAGAVIGLSVDGLVPHDRLLYRAPTRTSRWDVQPLFASRGWALAVARRF